VRSTGGIPAKDSIEPVAKRKEGEGAVGEG